MSLCVAGAGPEADPDTPRQSDERPRVPTGTRSADPVGSTAVLREGTQIEGASGVIRQKDSRFVFVRVDTGRELVLLENLALERVARLVARGNEAISCHVSGKVTEYRGLNYLLLGRTVLDASGEGEKQDTAESGERKGT